jgi:hypothetical protein
MQLRVGGPMMLVHLQEGVQAVQARWALVQVGPLAREETQAPASTHGLR